MLDKITGRKKIIVPVLTLSFLMPSFVTPNDIIKEAVKAARSAKDAVIEMYHPVEAKAANSVFIDIPDTMFSINDVRIYKDTYYDWMKIGEESGAVTIRPFAYNNRTFVPYRKLVEQLGGEVYWEQATQKITVKINNNTVEMWLGNQYYKVNGETRKMDVMPFVLKRHNRTVIPMRFIAEGLGYQVEYAEGPSYEPYRTKERYAIIFTKGQSEAEKKEVIANLIKPLPTESLVKNGKLTDTQMAQLIRDLKVYYGEDKTKSRYYCEVPANYPCWDDFVRLIKEQLGQDTIVDHKLAVKVYGLGYHVFAVTPDNRVHQFSIVLDATTLKPRVGYLGDLSPIVVSLKVE